MPPPSHENEPPAPRKTSWWSASRGSWRSPWSLDDEGADPPRKATTPQKRRRSSRIDTPSRRTVLKQPAITAMPPLQPPQPKQEPAPTQSAPPQMAEPRVRLRGDEPPVEERAHEQPIPQETMSPTQSRLPSVPLIEEQAVAREPDPAHAPSAPQVTLDVQPQKMAMAPPPVTEEAPAVRPAIEAPVFRSRRPQPPKAQPPSQPAVGAVKPPAEAARAPRVMSNPPPAEVIIHPEPRLARSIPPVEERELPPQIGEWPPRRPRAQQPNPWRRLMVFSLAVFAFTIVTWIYWQDEQPPAEETLQLKRDFDESPRPAAIARMRALLTSVAPVQRAEIVGVPPCQWEGPDLAKMVDANGVARENLRDLLEEPGWHPRHKAWFEEDIGIHGAWTTLTILKQAEAAYLMRRGEEEAAFTAAIDLAELARSLQELDSWPSYYDRSLHIFERASQTLVELLKTTTLDSVRLGAFQDEYVKCAPSDEVLRSAMSAWFLFEKKLMLGPESREPMDTLPGGIFYERPGRLFFKPSRTLQLFALSFHDLRAEAETPPYSRSSQITLRLGRIGPGVGLPNSAGEAYFAGRIVSYVALPDRQSIAHAQHAVVTTLFALRRYYADFKRFPPHLLNLRHEFLKEPPDDPFTGESLKYDIATGVVSSVGTNFTLDGGKPAEPPLSDPREIAAQAAPGLTK